MHLDIELINKAIGDIHRGKMVILVDDKDRENEGDLVVAADKVTPAHISFMAHHGCGLICMPMAADDFKRLDIPMMAQNNQCQQQTGFGVSIGAAEGITTGISAQDRAHTIRVAADPNSTAADIVKPGHVFPLKARDGGLLVRDGHTEASTDLVRMAGSHPAAVICEIMNPDGTMARLPDLKAFAARHQLTLIHVADLKAYRLQTEKLVSKISSAPLPTSYDPSMRINVYQNDIDGSEWVAVTAGDLSQQKNPLVRMHSACLTGDIFGSKRCDCGTQLDLAMKLIAKEGGVLLYLPQEGRGIGLANKVKAYELQDMGMDTVEANEHLGFQPDQRDYTMAAKILQDLGVSQVRLLTNNPAKVASLENNLISVAERVPLIAPVTNDNHRYMKTKQEKMGHLLV